MQENTILTVDVGGTKILIGEVSPSGDVLTKIKCPSDISTQENAMKQIYQVIDEYLENHQIGNIIAIGIDMVGRVNNLDGIWYEIDPENAQVINVSKLIKERYRLPCFIINDLAAATVAEKELGIGTETKNFIYLSIGTGIAGRIVFNGQIILGKDYDAGEFCHMVVDSGSDVQCICGRYSCVEPLASGLGMSNRAHELKNKYQSILDIQTGKRVNGKELFDAYDSNDPLALAVVSQSLKATANMVMNLTKAVNPRAIRFGGGVLTGGWYIKHLQRYLDPTTMRFVKYGVKNSDLDANLIALQGCALHAAQRL
ncbi:ROK family protein [Companilactobacillus huachuanensis]|uniref:ROK family protein n=1 Tax=Companilactobacillus huachuanensis TaxID=2559914 RepID=A0ABW1RM76_9LACO|nr:ROK family protein [Companilactobacillus huachuanensis]